MIISGRLVFLLRFLRESVADGEHGVTTHRVGPILCASLRTNPVLEAGYLTQNIIAAKFEDPFSLIDGFGECGVPIKAVVVHLAVGIASARMYGEVGLNGEIPRQFVITVEAIGKVPDVSGLFADSDVEMNVAIRYIALHMDIEFLVLEAGLGAEGNLRSTYTVEFGIGTARRDGKAGTFSVSQG